MWLARIEPDRPDHDKRTFECQACGKITSEVVSSVSSETVFGTYGSYAWIVTSQPWSRCSTARAICSEFTLALARYQFSM